MPHDTPADLRSPEESVALPWDAVRGFLATRGLMLDADPPPRQFAGGLANLNYLIHLDGRPYVLRRPPMGELPAGSHDMAREHRILSRLPDALPFVPRSVLLCDDPADHRPALPDPGIPRRPGDPRAHAARPRASSGDRRPAVAGAAGDDGGDPRGGYRCDRPGRPRPAGRFPGARRRRLAQARLGGEGRRHGRAASGRRRLAGTAQRAGWAARPAAQRLQAEQHDPGSRTIFRRSPWWTGTRARAAIRCSISPRC